MVYTFGCVGAVTKMRVEDYYTQGRRRWVRLHEKGGKRHEMPCHHHLEAYLDEYIAAAGLSRRDCCETFRALSGTIHFRRFIMTIDFILILTRTGTRACAELP